MVSSAVIGEHEDVLEPFCRRDSKGFQVSTREIDVLRSSAGDGPDIRLPSGPIVLESDEEVRQAVILLLLFLFIDQVAYNIIT
ncbi:unnamed protein product [Macrosiphum euphorbiae]|nr:unnamed protein product [Macrosiphum euphorbiae]